MADYAISNVPRRVVYANTGVGPYAFTFEILDQTDIAVYRGSTLLTITTDYTVTINLNGTGSVTLVTAGTGNITIVGAKNIQRTTDFTTGGDLFANTLNDELDNQTIFVQQVAETAERGLKAPVVDPTDINMTLPSKTDRAGTFLAFDSPSGNPIAGPSIASVGTVTQNIANINTVATNIADVNTVATNIANVNTVAGISGNVTTVAGISANVTSVAGNASNINTVAGSISNVNTVGTNIANVNTVAGIDTEITTVAGIDADVTTVAGISSDVSAVAAIDSDVTTVAGIDSDVTAVAADATDIGTVASNIANVNAVAGNETNINAVNANSTNINTVAGIDTDVTTVAGISANVTTVAGISANVTTVAGISSDVTTVATNVADVTNYADTYLGAKTSDPSTRNDSSALQAGDLYFNTADDVMKVYDGSAWQAAYVSLSGALIATNNLSDLTNTSAARQNLDLEIGVDVQAYDADTAKYDDTTANFTGTLQNGGSNVVVDSDIGTNVQAYNANLQGASQGGINGMKNRIINGAMGIWQRGTSSSSIGYQTVDRWSFYADSSRTVSRSTDVPTGFQYSTSLSGTGSTGLTQKIESINCYGIVGNSITISFWLKQTTGAGSNAIGLNLYYADAADDWNASTQISTTQNFTTTSGWAQYSATFSNMPSGSTNGLQVTIVTNSGSAVVFLLTGVQLEVGSTATSFDYRPYGTEFNLCQRYFEKVSISYLQMHAIYYDGSTCDSQVTPFQVTKRASPTCTATTELKQFCNYSGGGAVNATSVTINSNNYAYQYQYNGSSMGSGPIMNMGATTVNASAEL